MSTRTSGFRALCALGSLLALATATVPASAATPFDTLAGTWAGNGRVSFDNGQSEALRCNAYYRSLANGSQLRLSIRCASPAAKVDLRATLAYAGGGVSGNWEERTFNQAGSISGTAGANSMTLAFSGGIGGSMTVALGRSNHRVSITTSGSSLRSVTMTLGRGD